MSSSSSKLKVLYDGYIYSIQRAGGVNQYIAKMIDLASSSVTPTLATNEKRNVNFPTNPRLYLRHFQRFGFRPGFLSFGLEKQYFRHVMLRRDYDIFHPSLYGENLAQVSIKDFRIPVVVTFHDMIDELFPEVDETGVRRKQKAECVDAASAIICVSENTRRDLLKVFPQAAAKSYVVHGGCELNISQMQNRTHVPTQPYFLYVGGRASEYKNFKTLLRAFEEVAREHIDLRLAVAGHEWSDCERAILSDMDIIDKVDLFELPSEVLLSQLYYHSLALVYPSIYEGFGIPPLEAMQCQTCVIASNRASVPEVVGDAALLVDPDESGAFVNAMREVISSKSLRAELIQKGLKRHLMFSWQRCVDETFNVYRQVADR